MKPYFTVLITAYNYGQYVEQAVQSALAQTMTDAQFEVLVIDDGSTDDTRERVARFGDKVRYHYQKNAGQAAAFNAGVALAQGEFIAFLDADDYFVAGKLQLVKRYLESNSDVDVVLHPLIQVDELGRVLGVHPRSYRNQVAENPLKMFLEGRLPEPSPTSGGIVKKKLLQKLLPVPLAYRICADSYLQNTLPLLASAVGYLAEPLTCYRLHSNNLFNCFDRQLGRYSCKDVEKLHNKLVLDLKSVEDVAARFNIDLGGYLLRNKYQVTLQMAMSIRASDGALTALKYFCMNLHDLKRLKGVERIYRTTSTMLQLVLGPHVFSRLANTYVDSLPHRVAHRYFCEQRKA